jgi:hypothetical protein
LAGEIWLVLDEMAAMDCSADGSDQPAFVRFPISNLEGLTGNRQKQSD